MKNKIKNTFNKLEVPEDRRGIIFDDVLKKARASSHKQKENHTMRNRNKWKFAVAGVSVAACVALAIAVVPMLSGQNTKPIPPQTSDFVPAIVDTTNSPIIVQTPEPVNQQTEGMPVKMSQTLSHFAVQLDDNIYYSNQEDKNRLYKIKEDGTGKTKLSDIWSRFVQVVGNNVYWHSFTGVSDKSIKAGQSSIIYRMPIDGGEATCLLETEENIVYMKVAPDGVYYVYAAIVEKGGMGYVICRMNLDGSNKKNITEANLVLDFDVIGDYIYFNNRTEEVASSVFKMKKDGSEKVRFLDEDYTYFRIFEDYIYYSGSYFYDKVTGKRVNPKDYNGDGELKKYTNQKDAFFMMRLDGSEKAQISENSIGYFVVDKGYIYYTNDSDKSLLYKMKTDGTENKLFMNEWATVSGVIGDWIYFGHQTDELYKVRTDGTERQEVSFLGGGAA